MPKNKTGGIVTSTVFGIGGLIIITIIILVIVSTIIGAKLFEGDRVTSQEFDQSTIIVVNESGTKFGNNTLDGASCTIDTALNASGGLIVATNYTVTASTCTVAFITGQGSINLNNTVWTINSTTIHSGASEESVNDLTTNFTEGIGNISTKLPTILTIVAVVFLLGALVLLVRNANAMGIGSGAGGSSL